MAEKQVDFYVQAAALDKYIRAEQPEADPVAVRVVLKRLEESPDLYQYFFAQRPSPGWARLLLERGFFKNPARIIQVEGGFKAPQWPPSNYLADVAEFVPDVVVEAINQIDTDNPVILLNLVRALVKVPVNLAPLFVDRVRTWLNNRYNLAWWGLPEETSRLMVRLAENRFVRESLLLLDELLRPVATPISTTGDYTFGAISKSRFELTYLRPDFWQDSILQLERFAHDQVIRTLEANLVLALRLELEAEKKTVDVSSWPSHWWRSSVADTSQDEFGHYRDILLVALRDSLLRLVDRDPLAARKVIESYLGATVQLLRRIGIYCLSARVDAFPDLLRSVLLNPGIHQDLHVHNEYFSLLRSGFQVLADDEKASVLTIILAGPVPGLTLDEIKDIAAQYGEEPENYARRRKALWTRDRLWVIRTALTGEAERLLDALCQEYGEPEHPEFLSWSTGAFAVSDESPTPVETLSAMAPEELLTYVLSWQPDPRQAFGPVQITLQGLAANVAIVVLRDPDKYQPLMPTLVVQKSKIVEAILGAAEESVSRDEQVPWSFLLNLVRAVAMVASQLTADSSESFGARIGAMRLIDRGLEKRRLPRTLFDAVEEILVLFLNDPNPGAPNDTPSGDALDAQDPATTALNTVRPRALINVMELLVIRFNDAESLHGQLTDPTLSEFMTPSLQDAITQRVDWSLESSLAVHSVYGRFVWLLKRLDVHWFEARLPQIFPLDDGPLSEWYFVAAWESYVIFNTPDRWLLDILRPHYRRAIELLARGKITRTHLDPRSKLAQHILLDYLWQPYDLTQATDRNLLGRLFAIPDPEIRGRTMWIVWQLAKSMPEQDRRKRWPAIRALWKWRADEASLTNYPQNLSQEMEWLARLPILANGIERYESLSPLLDVFLPYVTRATVWLGIQEYLASQARQHPAQVISYYRRMFELADKQAHGLSESESEKYQILEAVLESPTTRREARQLLSFIGRQTSGRNVRDRELYEKYSRPPPG